MFPHFCNVHLFLSSVHALHLSWQGKKNLFDGLCFSPLDALWRSIFFGWHFFFFCWRSLAAGLSLLHFCHPQLSCTCQSSPHKSLRSLISLYADLIYQTMAHLLILSTYFCASFWKHQTPIFCKKLVIEHILMILPPPLIPFLYSIKNICRIFDSEPLAASLCSHQFPDPGRLRPKIGFHFVISSPQMASLERPTGI